MPPDTPSTYSNPTCQKNNEGSFKTKTAPTQTHTQDATHTHETRRTDASQTSPSEGQNAQHGNYLLALTDGPIALFLHDEAARFRPKTPPKPWRGDCLALCSCCLLSSACGSRGRENPDSGRLESFGPLGQHPCVLATGVLPVYKLPEAVNVGGPQVLVIEVVGVFPDVAREERETEAF